ncbi:MAG TPA: hypothetical protein VK503_03855 [Candidatus Bathyarchaeia archaeon]|nr:hypothetical protein [Candidatus Bathyarchaeia archaeon]
MRLHAVAYIFGAVGALLCSFLASIQLAFAQSPQASLEWRLFNQILLIGIVVGIVVFGLLFYAIIRYREKPEKSGAS